jgi:type I restriction enzyme S subunit
MTISQIEMNAAELAIVRDILGRFIPEREVRAFGSRVNGMTKKFSDLDLAIMGQEPVPLAIMADLRDAFTESDLPYKVDLIEWANTSPTFKNIIEARSIAVTAEVVDASS